MRALHRLYSGRFFGSTPATLLRRSKFSCKHCITCGPFEAISPSLSELTSGAIMTCLINWRNHIPCHPPVSNVRHVNVPHIETASPSHQTVPSRPNGISFSGSAPTREFHSRRKRSPLATDLVWEFAKQGNALFLARPHRRSRQAFAARPQ